MSSMRFRTDFGTKVARAHARTHKHKYALDPPAHARACARTQARMHARMQNMNIEKTVVTLYYNEKKEILGPSSRQI